LRFGRKYKTRPFEQILQDTFKEETIFGGIHDESSSYFTKVAITPTTDTGERPVIFTNYNREIETHRKKPTDKSVPCILKIDKQAMILCDPITRKNEFKLWEVYVPIDLGELRACRLICMDQTPSDLRCSWVLHAIRQG
jgi:hypothetical protein